MFHAAARNFILHALSCRWPPKGKKTLSGGMCLPTNSGQLYPETMMLTRMTDANYTASPLWWAVLMRERKENKTIT